MSETKPYCKACNLDLTLHADGTIACNCTIWDVGEDIPSAWAFGDNEDGELALIESVELWH